jgi:pimeloyl-ACP methyl ester carboxylesterase
MNNNIVLIHGAWLGGWCWDKVITLLQKSGANVSAPDLPGHAKDKTIVSKVTLDSYVERIAELIPRQGPPVVLVGHSMAGLVISTVAEKMPDRVALLIYLAAYILTNGESIAQVSPSAGDSLVAPNMEFAPDYTTVGIKKAALKDVFCADAEDSDASRVQELSRLEPLGPFNSKLSISDANYGRVPRFYIRTSQDRAVTPSLQEQMLQALPCSPVRARHTSHTPFFSAPQELLKHIIELSRATANAYGQ